MSQQKNKLCLRVAVMAMMVASSSALTVTTSVAQSAGADRSVTVAIEAQSLSDALRQLAEASGMQLVYDARITDGRMSPGVSGTMSARAALTSLLAGSGLNVQFSGDRTAIITANSSAGGEAVTEDGVRAVGVVNVEGATGNMPFGNLASPTNGVNGSRDVQATEGTGSYTTNAASIGSKVPQELRDTPASVSIMTAQQIDDQALVGLRDIMEKMTGITTTFGGQSEEFSFESRGFRIGQLTIDGGAPLIFEYNNRPVIDISEFDSVQLVRGADGLFGGYGDPGGAVNLQRKKPLDHRQITYEQDIGSFSNFREEFDITGPMGFDGRLRGRLVLARTDKDSYYDVTEQHKSSIYGVMEYDVSPDTLLTFGGNYVQERNIPNGGGLPRFADGREIDFDVSTCFCVPWTYDDANRSEIFLTVDHRFNDSLSSRLAVTWNEQLVEGLYYNSTAYVVPGGSARGRFGGYSTRNPTDQVSVDFSTNGKFRLFGREHTFVAGASYQHIDNSGGVTAFEDGVDIPDIFNFNPSDYTQPVPRPFFLKALEDSIDLYGAYANLRAEIFSNLHATIGVRYSKYVDSGGTFQTDYSQSGMPDPPSTAPKLRDENVSDPSFGLTYDFLDNFSLYGSYQAIYRPQTGTRFSQITDPPPVTGENKEIGLKWQSPNGRLNAFISAYEVTQNGFLTEDFMNPGSLIPLIQDTTSTGIDAEIQGELMPGLQVSLGYAYNDNEIQYQNAQAPKSSYTPQHVLKAWATYRGQQGSRFERFVFGGGLYLQSSAYNRGSICRDTPTDDRDAECVLGFAPYEFTTDAYATFSGRVGYRLTNNIEVALNVENVGNLKTYSANPVSNIAGYNFYIEPRSFTLSLRARW